MAPLTNVLRRGSARTPLVLTAVTLLVLLALILFFRGDRPFSQADAKAVERVLVEQQTAWNKGDLEAFMSGYHRSPEMTFYAGGDARRGWDDALDRYRHRYQGEGKEMGTLTFSELQIEGAGPDHAWVRGRWHVAFRDGKTATGLFTLVFRRFADGWRIVHDHTSEAEKPPAPPE
jgi:ketosteroid isomerase-like protein